MVDRARDMYSAVLIKEDVLETKRLLKTKSKKITASLESVNRALLDLKRQCDELLICTLSMTDALLGRLLRLQSVMDEFLQDPSFSEKKLSEEQFSQLLDFYFNIRSFVNVYELVDEHYLIYCDYNDNSNFCVHLQCMNPSANLEQYLAMGRSAIFSLQHCFLFNTIESNWQAALKITLSMPHHRSLVTTDYYWSVGMSALNTVDAELQCMPEL